MSYFDINNENSCIINLLLKPQLRMVPVYITIICYIVNCCVDSITVLTLLNMMEVMVRFTVYNI